MDESARVAFSATGEVALAAGWHYLVVTGWRPQVMATLDALSAQRRPLDDRLGLEPELMTALAAGPCTRVWLGEVAGLEQTLGALRGKRQHAQRLADQGLTDTPVPLG